MTILEVSKSVEGNTTEYTLSVWRWSITLEINTAEMKEAFGIK
jgi:hypothetical protein